LPRTEYLKIPLDRLGPLIGIGGETKRKIEILTGTLLYVNSEDGTVVISPSEDMEDSFGVMNAVDIVKSIGKGFHPEVATKLNDDDVYLEEIEISLYAGESEEELNKQIARVIGKKGLVVNRITSMTGISIKVYNNEVSLIGDFEKVMIAKEAFVMILNGSNYKTVFDFLKTKQDEKYLKIPLDRIGPLIGKNAETKREIETLTGTLLYINSDDGTVAISQKEDMEDSFGVMNAVDIVKSIGKGFHPKTAIELNNEDIYLEEIEVSSYIDGSEEELNRQIARVIGKKGFVINNIRDMADVSIKVYNNEVSLIGDFENVMIAKKAIVMILTGLEYKSAFDFLKTKQNEIR